MSTDEPLTLECVQRHPNVLIASVECACPEHLADDGGVLEQPLLGCAQPVDARGDDALQGLRQAELVGRSPFAVEVGELLCVERISTGALEQRLLILDGEERRLEEESDQARRLVRVERDECERGRVQLATAPAGPALEELGPCRRHDEHRCVSHPVAKLVDEIEQHLVRPVEILEHEHERPLLGEPFEEPAPRGERLAPPIASQLGLVLEPDERAQVRLDPALRLPTRRARRKRRRGASRPRSQARPARGCRPVP